MAGEDSKTEDPLCVTETTAFKQDLVGVHRYFSVTAIQDEIAFKLIQVLIGCLAFDLSFHKRGQGLLLTLFHELNHLRASLLLLKIGLSVKVLGLDETDTFWQAAIQQDQICREILVFHYFDDASDLDL